MGKNVCWRFFDIKIPGSTVLEVIVSLTICMIIFTISMRVILNIQTNHNIETKQRAVLLTSRDRIWDDSVSVGLSNDHVIEDGNLQLESDTLPDDQFPDLVQVTQIVKLKDGRSIQKSSFLVRKTIQGTQ